MTIRYVRIAAEYAFKPGSAEVRQNALKSAKLRYSAPK